MKWTRLHSPPQSHPAPGPLHKAWRLSELLQPDLIRTFSSPLECESNPGGQDTRVRLQPIRVRLAVIPKAGSLQKVAFYFPVKKRIEVIPPRNHPVLRIVLAQSCVRGSIDVVAVVSPDLQLVCDTIAAHEVPGALIERPRKPLGSKEQRRIDRRSVILPREEPFPSLELRIVDRGKKSRNPHRPLLRRSIHILHHRARSYAPSTNRSLPSQVAAPDASSGSAVEGEAVPCQLLHIAFIFLQVRLSSLRVISQCAASPSQISPAVYLAAQF